MMAKRKKQTGSALITVLFLAVILSFLVLSISQSTTVAAERAFIARTHAEVYWRLIGVEALARSAIESALGQNSDYLASDNPLFAIVYDLPMDDATAQVAFADNTRCLNLNSFSVSDDRDGRGKINETAKEEFSRLSRSIGVSGGDAEIVFTAVADWIDVDDFQEPGGAEDNFYTSLPTPYRTGGGPLADQTELRAMSGVSAEVYLAFAPYLCAHPFVQPTSININLLTVDDAPLLAAVFDNVSLAKAAEIIAARPPGGYRAIADFEEDSGLKALNVRNSNARRNQNRNRNRPTEEDDEDGNSGNVTSNAPRIDVKSQFLSARAVVSQGDMALELNLVFRINGDTAEVVSRRIGRRI